MVCLYHLDDDGKCAAAIVRIYGQHAPMSSQFIPMNYGYAVPFDRISKDETVYIVDFSIEPDDMRKLLQITSDVIWIDHHITAIQKYADFETEIELKGIRSVRWSGCMLTYLYMHELNTESLLHSEKSNIWKVIPHVVRYCDSYDMWTFRMDGTKLFHMGFETVEHDPEMAIWDELLSSRPEATSRLFQIIDKGAAVMKYHENRMKSLIQSYGYPGTLDGHSCYVLNQGLISSDDFESVDTSMYDLLVGYIYDGEKYCYSLRSTKIDVSQLAKSHGGGGHPEAAGFNSPEMLIQSRK